jgi:hydrogenase-1 operon protein HyaE
MGTSLNGKFVRRDQTPTVDADSVDAFLTATPDAALLLFRGDATRPEVADIAVVLPQLVAAFPGRLSAAVVAPAAEAALMARYGVKATPSLALVRGGQTLGVIAKIQDWSVYLARIGQLLADARCTQDATP